MTERAHRNDASVVDDSGFAATVQHELPAEDSQPAEISLPFAESAPAGDLLADDPPVALDAEPTIGHVGRYALKRLIGEGGLGTVYAAWDPILARAVALKTLNLAAQGADRSALDNLFAHEARAVAGLSHPHIVTVFDAGVDPQRGAYLAMEQLVGQDLRQLLVDAWRPSPTQAARLVRRLADALTYAHGMGVVHCDIKPANVFMVERRRPKILDFGIARLAREHARDEEPLLPSAGSPQYAAPEQLRGDAADARTDVHALGLLLYELLTGRKAFEGRTLQEIEAAVQGPRPPSAHALSPAVPSDLSRIVERAMALDPGERFASARDLSRALRRWTDEQPAGRGQRPSAEAPAAPAGPTGTAARNGRRAGAIVLGLVAAAAIAGFAWQSRAPEADGRTSAVAPAVPAPDPAPSAAAAGAAQMPAPAEPIDTAADSSGPAKPAPISSARPTGTLPAAQPALSPAQAAALRFRAPKPREPEVRPEVATPATPAAPPANGMLQFAVTPWGQIEVDGKPAGTSPPLTRLSLPEGEHQVTIRNGDFPPHSITVRVEADQPVHIRHRFGS